MEHIIRAKNTTVTPSIQNYVEKRFAKFAKYAPDDMVVHTKIEVKEGGDRHKVEVTISFGKQTLRAEANSTHMYAAIDDVEKTMSMLLKKRKDKMTEKHRQPKDFMFGPENEEKSVDEYKISRTKEHDLQAMTAQEACEAMDMISHPFFVYFDDNLKTTCAVYKRDDGTYGQLVYHSEL